MTAKQLYGKPTVAHTYQEWQLKAVDGFGRDSRAFLRDTLLSVKPEPFEVECTVPRAFLQDALAEIGAQVRKTHTT